MHCKNLLCLIFDLLLFVYVFQNALFSISFLYIIILYLMCVCIYIYNSYIYIDIYIYIYIYIYIFGFFEGFRLDIAFELFVNA